MADEGARGKLDPEEVTGIASISVREVDSLESLEALRDAWLALAGRLHDPSPFLLPQFLLPQIRWVASRYAFRVLTAWQDGELVGLAPLFARRIGKWGVHVTTLSFPVHGTSPPFDLLVRPGMHDVIARFREAWDQSADWDVLLLENVAADSNARALSATEGSSDRLKTEVIPGRASCYTVIQGTWDDYLRSRSTNLRNNHRRAWNRCRSAGATRVVRFPQEGIGLDEALGHVDAVLDRSWKRPHDDGLSVRHLLRDLAAELHRDGLLSIRLVMVGDRPVCYLFEIDHRSRLYAFHTAYALDAQDLWPGVVVLGDALRDAHERRYERYDLGGEARVYLAAWATHTADHVCVRLRAPRLASRWKVPLFDLVRSGRRERARRRTDAGKQTMKGLVPGSGGDAMRMPEAS